MYRFFITSFILRIVEEDGDSLFGGIAVNKQYQYDQVRPIVRNSQRIMQPCTDRLLLTLINVTVLDIQEGQSVPTILLSFNSPEAYAVNAKFAIDINESSDSKKDTMWTMSSACSAFGITDTDAQACVKALRNSIGESTWVIIDEPESKSYRPNVTFVSAPKELVKEDSVSLDDEATDPAQPAQPEASEESADAEEEVFA